MNCSWYRIPHQGTPATYLLNTNGKNWVQWCVSYVLIFWLAVQWRITIPINLCPPSPEGFFYCIVIILHQPFWNDVEVDKLHHIAVYAHQVVRLCHKTISIHCYCHHEVQSCSNSLPVSFSPFMVLSEQEAVGVWYLLSGYRPHSDSWRHHWKDSLAKRRYL